MFIFGLRTHVQSVAKIKAFEHSFGFRVRPQAGVRVRVRVRGQACDQAGVEARAVAQVGGTISHWDQGPVCGWAASRAPCRGSRLRLRLCLCPLGALGWGCLPECVVFAPGSLVAQPPRVFRGRCQGPEVVTIAGSAPVLGERSREEMRQGAAAGGGQAAMGVRRGAGSPIPTEEGWPLGTVTTRPPASGCPADP
ncbi:hypothetical protein HJG60_010059 [Phyllostomus discolor]|uniref:Uncharacterized protein n=1 Tax=Phyllostomus discolor TaxID=89673 RepID=A0A834AYK6_9CHIR|nr:hypothetical protein HJG60_010059 [Phyllostomus discolor]